MKTEPRTVDISKYWIPRVRETAEFQQIANALNPEFNMLIERQNRMLEDGFILEATEYGVERWEAILHLTVPDRMTLDERKQQILNKLSVKIPYTMPVLRQMLAAIVGEGNFTLSLDNDTQILDTQFKVISRSNVSAVQQLLKRVLPMNLDLHMLVDGVPAQYTLLEYLESSGTQWINTRLYLHGNSRVEFEAMPLKRNYTNFFFDSRQNTVSTGMFGLSYGYNGANSHTMRIVYGDQYRYIDRFKDGSSGVLALGEKYSFLIDKGLTYKNGSPVSRYLESTGIQEQSFTSVMPCYIFASVGNGAITRFTMRMYSFSVKENDASVLDLVPVLNPDGVPGMYDRVSKTFIANTGTGTFGYRIKTPASDTMQLDLDDPYYTAPSGVWAKLIAENTLDIIADTDLADGTTQGYTWFANSGDAYQYFNIEEVNEND